MNCLWKFSYTYNYGKFDGIFKATIEEIDAIIGRKIIIPNIFNYYDHGIEIEINWYMIELVSDDPIIIKKIPSVGYNPLDYIGEE